jgi:predicted metal-dependent HD superfamily phosphohydrolase
VDLRKRWAQTWRALGVRPDEAVFLRLIERYGEPHRHYHSLQHLEECFHHFDALKAWAGQPHEIELALWFHDAIYDTHRHDNEERSAQWAVEAISPSSQRAAKRVHALVMATRHEAVPEGTDAQILVDVDLAILGAAIGRFDDYEMQVRREYAWVPETLYRSERRKILTGFASRARLYRTEFFFERYEAQARANIARSLARL